MTDPYVAAGLQRNPFVADDGGDVGSSLFVDLGLPEPDSGVGVTEIVGPRGAGKTTHLRRWCARLDGRYHHLPRGRWVRGRTSPANWRGLPGEGVVAWDEVDRLPRIVLGVALRRARQRRALVMLGTHAPTGLADRSLFLPAPTAAAVREFARRRIAAVAVDGAAVARQVPDAAAAAAIAGAADFCWWTVGTLLHDRCATTIAGGVPAPGGAGLVVRS